MQREKALKSEKLEKAQQEYEKQQHIQKLRSDRNRDFSRQETEILERQNKNKQLRERYSSVANKEILIKKETAKLRQLEISQFKSEVEADRRHYQ